MTPQISISKASRRDPTTSGHLPQDKITYDTGRLPQDKIIYDTLGPSDEIIPKRRSYGIQHLVGIILTAMSLYASLFTLFYYNQRGDVLARWTAANDYMTHCQSLVSLNLSDVDCRSLSGYHVAPPPYDPGDFYNRVAKRVLPRKRREDSTITKPNHKSFKLESNKKWPTIVTAILWSSLGIPIIASILFWLVESIAAPLKLHSLPCENSLETTYYRSRVRGCNKPVVFAPNTGTSTALRKAPPISSTVQERKVFHPRVVRIDFARDINYSLDDNTLNIAGYQIHDRLEYDHINRKFKGKPRSRNDNLDSSGIFVGKHCAYQPKFQIGDTVSLPDYLAWGLGSVRSFQWLPTSCTFRYAIIRRQRQVRLDCDLGGKCSSFLLLREDEIRLAKDTDGVPVTGDVRSNANPGRHESIPQDLQHKRMYYQHERES